MAAVEQSMRQEARQQTARLFTSDLDLPFTAARDSEATQAAETYKGTTALMDAARKEALASKMRGAYADTVTLPFAVQARQPQARQVPSSSVQAQRQAQAQPQGGRKRAREGEASTVQGLIDQVAPQTQAEKLSTALSIRAPPVAHSSSNGGGQATTALARRAAVEQLKPAWHAPWKLGRVLAGHAGWVRCVAMDPLNQFFVTGSADRTIKIWDLASGTLRLSLTGHISTVRGLAVSSRHPYLFSCGEDKQVKCWDLEANKVIRHYHGHLSGVYSLSLHPTIDVLVTAGRDAVARCWDMRTRQEVHVLGGHKATVADVTTCAVDPQVITGSLDHTVKLWDLAAGKCMQTLTHHKKSIRSLSLSLTERSFVSGGADRMRSWTLPAGQLLNVMDAPGHEHAGGGIVNTTSVNVDGVLFAGSDDGSLGFYDYKSGVPFQQTRSAVQPGSLESENGVFCSTFDRTGLRLVTGEADKTIKVWRQDSEATQETHPLQWTPSLQRRKY